MEPNAYSFYAERCEPGRNIARYYAVSIERTLFGDLCVVRRWGRIGARGRIIRQCFDQPSAALAFSTSLARKKMGRGYVPH